MSAATSVEYKHIYKHCLLFYEDYGVIYEDKLPCLNEIGWIPEGEGDRN
jgi:hypothetical protein